MEQAIEQQTETLEPGGWRSVLLRFERPFLISVGVILFVTGVAKLYSAGGGQRALNVPSPLFLIPYKHLFLGVGLLEIGIAGYLLFKEAPKMQVLLVAWLSWNFLLYRIATYLMGVKAPCGCLGTLTDSLRISAATIDQIMTLIVIYLFSLSSVYFWFRGRNE